MKKVILWHWLVCSGLAPMDGQAMPALFAVTLPAVPEPGSRLKEDEVLIEYDIHDSIAYIHTITRESECLTLQTLDLLFWQSLVMFEKRLKSADPAGVRIQAEILYLYLLGPVRDHLEGKRRLLLVPGHQFGGVPFEALIMGDGNHGSTPGARPRYLIADFEIVYHDAAGLPDESMPESPLRPEEPGCRGHSFAGFSPASVRSGDHGFLPFAGREVTAIADLFMEKGGAGYLDCMEEAGIETFGRQMVRGGVVHIASHFVKNPGRNSGGSFYYGCGRPGEEEQGAGFYLADDSISSLDINADLVVLSGCATGRTWQETGTTLPHMLRLAGARNVLSTLWNVTDNLAACFMVDFYRSWMSGKTYSEALREVKLRWISRTSTSLPAIWAPYVLTGRGD